MKQFRSAHPVWFRIIFIPLCPAIFLLLTIAMALAILYFMILSAAYYLIDPVEARKILPDIIHELSFKLRGK